MTSASSNVAISNHRVPGLDGWRGISITMVIISHLLAGPYRQEQLGALENIPLGAWGVKLFFIISGFIICKLALREMEETGKFSIWRFWVRRIARIAPPLFVYLAFVFMLVELGVIDVPASYFFSAATFTCNLPGTSCGWFVGHTWSLAFEEQFYLLFPLAMLAGRRRARFIFGGLVVLLVVASRPTVGEAVMSGAGRDLSKFLGSFIALFSGVLCALHEERLRRLAATRFWLLTACASLIMGMLVLDYVFPAALPISSVAHARILGLADATVIPAAMSWMIVSTCVEGNPFGSALNWGPLRGVGMISYSLYLWQELFCATPTTYHSGGLLLFWPCMFAVALASYYVIERPSARIAKALVRRRVPKVSNSGKLGNVLSDSQ